jgi:hypothetical protein
LSSSGFEVSSVARWIVDRLTFAGSRLNRRSALWCWLQPAFTGEFAQRYRRKSALQTGSTIRNQQGYCPKVRPQIHRRLAPNFPRTQPLSAGKFRQQIGKDRSRQRRIEMALGWSSSKNIQQHGMAQWQTFVKNTIPSPSRTRTTAISGRLRLFKPTTSSTKLTGVENEFPGLCHSCYRPRRTRF